MYRTTQRCPVCKSLKWEHHYLNILKHLSPHTSCISRPNSLFLLNYFLKMTVGLILFCSLRCAMLCTVQYNAMFSLGIFYCFFLQQFHFKGVCCLDRGRDLWLDRWRVGFAGQPKPHQHIQVFSSVFHKKKLLDLWRCICAQSCGGSSGPACLWGRGARQLLVRLRQSFFCWRETGLTYIPYIPYMHRMWCISIALYYISLYLGWEIYVA